MKVAVLLALCALSASCASLQDNKGGGGMGAQDFGRRGAYSGISLIQGFENFDTPSGVSAGDSDFGIGFKGGMRMNEKFAIEGVLEGVGGYEISSGPFSEDLDMVTFGAQGKYYFSPEKVQPYVLAGLGLVRADVNNVSSLDDTGTYFRIGGGADFYVSRDVAIFGELNINELFGDVNELDYFALQVGVLWRF